MTPRALRIVALCYLVKTLLVGVAWLAVPDLPHRVRTFVRSAVGSSTQAKATSD